MRQKFLIFISIVGLFVILIGLNAAAYVKKEQTPDSEFKPNRSTYNTGATGTRAFYDLLAETGRTAVRWQESTDALAIKDRRQPSVFVLIGTARREITGAEINALLRWVNLGGRLVVIDRAPPDALLRTTADWNVSMKSAAAPPFADSSDVPEMTAQTSAAKVVQPSVFTKQINAVQPSKFAAAINFVRQTNDTAAGSAESAASQTNDEDQSPAPVALIAGDKKTLLAEFPYGAGRIVLLSDPYIVSNGGISLTDNAQLAINLVAVNQGIVAFDEFHQGYGAGQNHLLDYFEGTPLIAVALQIGALIAVILFTQSRRFARPLPAVEPNRLSKLEYVAAMAELQQRTKAYDLAMENIYKDFRRRASRLVGADALKTKSEDFAALIAARIKLDNTDIADTLAQCEAIMHGEPTNKKEMINLTSRLREIEEKLGLQRRKRQNGIG